MSALPGLEHPAVLRAFNIPSATQPRIIGSDRYWQTELTTADGQVLSVVISSIGGSGNAAAEIPVERMVRNFQPEAMFLVGIACGLPAYNLGDVVTSEVVLGYEYAKNTPQGRLNRSRAKSTPTHLVEDVGYFGAHAEWQEEVKRLGANCDPKEWPRANFMPTLRPSVWIASGEKVMADGELLRLNQQHDKISAGEMEGFGFADACEKQRPRVPWLVIRGISDHGDPSKDGGEKSADAPKKDEYHLAAAISGAAFLRVFLEKNYLPSGTSDSRYQPASGTLNDKQIIAMAGNGLLIAEEFAPENVKQACYELRVGDTYHELGSETVRSTQEFGNVLLKPRQLTVVITKESLKLPENIVGRILTKGQLFSVGVLPVNTYADPGFQGKIGVVLYNASANYLKLVAGQSIAKIEFSTLTEPVEHPYNGQHGYQSKIWPIPTGMRVPDEVAMKDPRVDDAHIEAERAYGKQLAVATTAVQRMGNYANAAIGIAIIALLVALAALLR